jgi:chemotaxis protein MotB
MATKKGAVPIIIKKVKAAAHGAHHGGAWKVAYADFVTAMMSFFLLLWLLNVTTDVQKRGIADYFAPTISSKSQDGAGGVLGGLTIGKPGSQAETAAEPSLRLAQMAMREASENDDSDDDGKAASIKQNDDADAPATGKETETSSASAKVKSVKPLDESELQKQLGQREEKRFEAAEKALRAAMQDVPDLAKLADNLVIDRTPEGLRIQIVDQDRQPMFPLGSAEMLEPAKKLMALVAQAVLRLPNKISISGHTDATPYALGKYSNWELSADRANASRREFVGDGVPEDRISRVVGQADRDPLVPDDPTSPRNRRISVVILREAKELPPTQFSANESPDAPH